MTVTFFGHCSLSSIFVNFITSLRQTLPSFKQSFVTAPPTHDLQPCLYGDPSTQGTSEFSGPVKKK